MSTEITIVPYKVSAKEIENVKGTFNLIVESIKIPESSVSPLMWTMKLFKDSLPFSFHIKAEKEVNEANMIFEMSVPVSEKVAQAVMKQFADLMNISETVH